MIECPDPGALEDKLSNGERFKLLGKATVLDGSDGRDATLLADRRNEDGRKDFILDAMKRGDLHAHVAETELEGRLTELYRASKLAFEEGGANILYLCLGFLKWTPQDGAGPYRAPLILIPVQLERKSVRSGFRLALHEDEARFNPTLMQMLKQDFDLTIPEFDIELPHDASGINVAGVWKTVRLHIKSIRGWEVTEQVTLATLSFTKYLMWKDLVDRTDLLKRNPVVAHLIDTPTHSYGGSGAGFIDARTIDELIDPVDLFAPLSADFAGRSHRRRSTRRRLCAVRAARDRQEPDHCQRHHQLPRARQDGSVRFAEDRSTGSRPAAHAGRWARELLSRGPLHQGAEVECAGATCDRVA